MKAVLGLSLFLFAQPALACSCAPVNAATPRPSYLVLAEVLKADLSPDGQAATTTLRVTKRYIGTTAEVITVHSRAHSAACGVTFTPGKRQLFALARHNGRYVTNLCLMQQARL